MEIIAHRINSVKELESIPTEYGIEIDLRDQGSELILQHDPFSTGERFEDLLKSYKHKTIILNIKSERIEHKVLELISKYKIENYFFLDSSFPMINLLSKNNEHNLALRYSEYEGLDTIQNFKGKAKWVWVDCFTYLPLTEDINKQLKELGYKTCIVSPELQGRPEDIVKYREQLKKAGIIPDAVCTKIYNVDLWKELIN